MEIDEAAAREIVAAADAVLNQIGLLLDTVHAVCPKDKKSECLATVAKPIADLDLDLLEPLYQQHPHLRPTNLEPLAP